MSTKKPAALLAFVGACALAVTGPATLASPVPPGPSGVPDGGAAALPVGDIDTALTSKSGQSAPSSTGAEADPARVVGVIVQLADGASREREGRVSDVATPDAEGGVESTQTGGQDPANLSAHLMMHVDQVAQKGEGKVIAVIDTGVDMTHPAFTGELVGRPPLTPQKVAAMTSQLGEGKTGDSLGYNPLVKAADHTGNPNPRRYVVSRSTTSGAPTILEPRTGTLRSVHSLTSTYTNEAGETISEVTNHRNWKSLYLTSTGENTWVEAYHESTAFDANADPFA